MAQPLAVTCPILTAASTVKLFSEATVDPAVANLVGNLGVIGVLIWHLWYHTTKSQPAMLERFAAEQEKTRLAFAHEQKETRDHNAREMAEMRNLTVQTLQGFRSAVHDVKDTAQSAIFSKAEAAAAKPPSA